VRKKLDLNILKNFSTDRSCWTNSTGTQVSKPIAWTLFASVCIERTPIITCDKNELENRYFNLINEINIRKSLLSDHELRHLKDLEAIKKRKEAKENETQELIVETAVDYEDKCLKQLNTFKFADRKTNDVYNLENQTNNNNNNNENSPTGVLKNMDRILDKKLILLIYDQEKSIWQLPKLRWEPDEISLRYTGERLISSLNDKLKVDFLGNAPCAVHKSKQDAKSGEKCYIFKAQYKSGGDLLALTTGFDYAWIRKDELPDFIKNSDYLECLNNIILDF